ncbi:hypothetical protein GCM10010411_91310 [Actinomadura fulvescens]|uniref:Tetracycline repressor TetR C-terminal domain-containing protein n=1 Tax=Actinomadura fulvescens TaxID=46160 RepID=A0ABP6DBL1_9ACTN
MIADTMAQAIEVAKQFPRLRTRIETADYAAAPDRSFEFGLEAIFDGLESRLAARHTPQQGVAQERSD